MSDRMVAIFTWSCYYCWVIDCNFEIGNLFECLFFLFFKMIFIFKFSRSKKHVSKKIFWGVTTFIGLFFEKKKTCYYFFGKSENVHLFFKIFGLFLKIFSEKYLLNFKQIYSHSYFLFSLKMKIGNTQTKQRAT